MSETTTTEDYYSDWKGSVFAETESLGKIVFEQIIDYYDGPMLFTAKNEKQFFFVHCVGEDRDEKITTYVLSEISEEQCLKIMRNLELFPLATFIKLLENHWVLNLKYPENMATISKISIEEMEKSGFMFESGVYAQY